MESLLAYSNWIVYVALIFLTVIPVVEKGFAYKISNGVLFIYLLIFALFGIFGFFTADWSSYVKIVDIQFQTNGQASTHIEPVWRWLAIAVKGNIYLFRAIIYSCTYGILFLFVIIFIPKKNRFLFLFLFFIYLTHFFAGMRQALSIVLFYFAYSLLQKNIPCKIFGWMLIAACFFLHHATILFLPSLLLSHIRLSRKIIIVSVIVEVAAIVWFYLFFADFAKKYFEDASMLYYLPENFTGPAGSRRNMLIRSITAIAIIVFFGLVLIKSFKYRLSIQGQKYRAFLYYGYLFYLILYITRVLASVALRFPGMLMIPMIMLLSEMRGQKQWKSKNLTIAFYICALIYFIKTNITISGTVGFGKGLFG
jgi:hypothetical protein